jgi:hypothetical protein
MKHIIKRLTAAILAVATVIKIFSVLSTNDILSKAYGCFSPADANQATNTFNDDRPKNYQSPVTDRPTTEANALFEFRRHLSGHDDVTPIRTTKIDAGT